MHNYKKWLYVSMTNLVLVSCNSFSPELQFALKHSGENRKELEKVLLHYSQSPQDSLKYKAAVFLIENMPGHQSTGGESLKQYYAEADSIYSTSSITDKIAAMTPIVSKYKDHIKVYEDIKVITSNYLIANIDQAYKSWQEAPYAQHINFEEFCEYILPYKTVERQPLDNWRTDLENSYHHQDDSVLHYATYLKSSAYWACSYLNYNMRRLTQPVAWDNTFIPILKPSLLAKIPPGTCDGFTLMATSVMRSQGVPVAIDFTPQWPFMNLGHSWNVVLTNNGKNTVFAGIEAEPGVPHKPDQKMAKVYRHTYALNKELLQLNQANKYVPPVLKDLYIKDVTNEYMQTLDIEADILPDLQSTEQYAYLGLFTIHGWNAIQWGKVQKNKVIFKEMGRDEVYLPFYYLEKEISPLTYPILIGPKGEQRKLEPDTTRLRTIKLQRKYHIATRVYNEATRLYNGVIEASQQKDFTDARLISPFRKITFSGAITVQDTNKYRYWRYRSGPGDGGCIADLIFYETDTLTPIRGQIIGGEALSPQYIAENAFDGDPLTFFFAKTEQDNWVGMDFEQPVRIQKIIYYPRTDDNCVRLEDTYELFYWGLKGWISLGQQVAHDYLLEFKNVPDNALLWLHDLTRGQEEQPFIWENNEQKWL